MPERYRVRYAPTADEVLRELQKFVDYVKNGPVITLLPSTLHGLSSQDPADVTKWQVRIARARLRTCPVGASAEYWLNLLDEMFTAARHRLEELSPAGDEGPSAAVPVASSPARPEA